MRLMNPAGCAEAKAFIRREAQAWRTEALTVSLRHTRYRTAGLYGYFRKRNILIVAAVNPAVSLPALMRFSARTRTLPSGDFRLGQDEETAASLDELMVWVFFHEFHHFLCYTRQRTWDSEIHANAYAFEALRKFKARRNSGPREPVPAPGPAVRFRERVMDANWTVSDSPGLVPESPASLSAVK